MAAKLKKTPLPDSYYEAMQQAKIAAGLRPEDAIEVTARQRAEDLANGVTVEETETEPSDEA